MPIPPHMWMLSIAASSALAGAAIVHLLHSRRTFSLTAGETAAGMRGGVAKIWAKIAAPFGRTQAPVSGNSSFDAHAAHVVDELDSEQSAFDAFRDHKRRERDKNEFQSFLATRRSPGSSALDQNNQ